MKEIINILKENKPQAMVKFAPGHVRIPLMVEGKVAVNLIVREDDYEYLTAEKVKKEIKVKNKKDEKNKNSDNKVAVDSSVSFK
jgi:hypothetical protein